MDSMDSGCADNGHCSRASAAQAFGPADGRAKYAARWIGHSTVLLRIGDTHVLTDPVLGRRCGLGPGFTGATIGPRRIAPPALTIDQLPRIDLVLLSHAHMDHFDIWTLKRLESRGTTVITAVNTRNLLRARRWHRVSELHWGESTRVGPLSIRAFRVQHWGARMIADVKRGYNGYVIEGERSRIIFGGDTALTDSFRRLRTSKPFDLAIMPIGAYAPWVQQHCTPEQAWKMGNDAGADFVLPVHHKTFPLGREPREEPIARFHDAAKGHDYRIAAKDIGDSFAMA